MAFDGVLFTVGSGQVVGFVASWEIALSVAITVATAWLAVRFASRIHTGGALRTRGTSTLRATITDDNL